MSGKGRLARAAPLLLGGALAGYLGFALGGAFGGISMLMAALFGVLLAGRFLLVEDPEERALVERGATLAVLLLPGLLTVYLAFQSGGFFPDAYGFAAVVLALVLAARICLAERPFEGYGGLVLAAAVPLGLYAAWTLASAAWSEAPARALLEFERVVLYLLALLLFGSLRRGTAKVAWLVRGMAAAIVAACLAALITRVLPDVWTVANDLANNRLSYPLMYWNALGALASIGIVLCLHLASAVAERPPVRALGAAAIPPLGATLLFTFSRGAIGALIVGVAVYLVTARPHGALAAVLAAGPPAAASVYAAYDAKLLAGVDPTGPAATAQGHDVALVVLLSALAAGLLRVTLVPLDRGLERIELRHGRRRALIGSAAAASLTAVVVLSLAAGVPGAVGRQYDRFVNTRSTPSSEDLRERLTSPANNGRIEHWDVAMDHFRREPLEGRGAGTYQLMWERDRPREGYVVDAHSLYVETLAELGTVGLLLLGAALLAILAAFALRCRGPGRGPYAALFAVGTLWALHAGVDWDWEMPVVSMWLFAAGGLAAARDGRARRRTGAPVRLAVAVGAVAVALPSALVAVSEAKLAESLAAFRRGDCATASTSARSSLSALGIRPEPHEVLGYCALQDGRRKRAVAEMRMAVDRDPRSWEYRYDLALARAAAGLDPRSAAAAALRYNPKEPTARALVRGFRTGDPRLRRKRAERTLVRSELIDRGPRRPGARASSP